MRELDHFDLFYCVNRLPGIVRDAMKGHPIVLAGGYIRSMIAREDVADIDLFTTSRELATKLADSFVGDGDRLYETENALTVHRKGTPIQVIHRWTFAAPQDVLPSFDFTIARAAIWYDHSLSSWTSQCDDRFYTDLSAKRLVYAKPERNEDAGGSLLRVLKFYQKGYRIPLDSLAAVIARLMGGIEPSTMIQTEDGLALALTGLLREVDPLRSNEPSLAE